MFDEAETEEKHYAFPAGSFVKFRPSRWRISFNNWRGCVGHYTKGRGKNMVYLCGESLKRHTEQLPDDRDHYTPCSRCLRAAYEQIRAGRVPSDK